MKFKHHNQIEELVCLHDCISERAYFKRGMLGFEFNEGFWISPDHPESALSFPAKTDMSRVEYTLYRGEACDVTVYVFKKNIFGQVVRVEWSVRKLISNINSGKCKVEFLDQFTSENERIVECNLLFDKKPYYCRCMIKLTSDKVSYFWNDLLIHRYSLQSQYHKRCHPERSAAKSNP